MKNPFHLLLLLALALLALTAVEAWAQPLAALRWQLTPFCNVVTLNVTAQGSIFTLDGHDDQCGAGQRASVVGTAFQNPDDTIGIGLNTVLAPGGAFVHVDARISLASLSGPWRDSAGNGGTFVLTPGAGTGGSPRPVPPNGLAPGSITAGQLGTGIIGSTHVDPSQVQARVSGSCPVGQYLRGISQNGSVTCEPLLLPVTASANVYRGYQTAISPTTVVVSLSANGIGALNVPFRARLMAYGAVEIAHNVANSLAYCYLSTTDNQVLGSSFEQLATNKASLPLAGTRDVEPGTYDVQIRCSTVPTNGWYNAQISVIAVPH